MFVRSYLKCFSPLVLAMVHEVRFFCYFYAFCCFDGVSVGSLKSYDTIFNGVRWAIDSVELSTGKSAIISLRTGVLSRVVPVKTTWSPSEVAMRDVIRTTDSPVGNLSSRENRVLSHGVGAELCYLVVRELFRDAEDEVP